MLLLRTNGQTVIFKLRAPKETARAAADIRLSHGRDMSLAALGCWNFRTQPGNINAAGRPYSTRRRCCVSHSVLNHGAGRCPYSSSVELQIVLSAFTRTFIEASCLVSIDALVILPGEKLGSDKSEASFIRASTGRPRRGGAVPVSVGDPGYPPGFAGVPNQGQQLVATSVACWPVLKMANLEKIK